MSVSFRAFCIQDGFCRPKSKSLTILSCKKVVIDVFDDTCVRNSNLFKLLELPLFVGCFVLRSGERDEALNEFQGNYNCHLKRICI